MTLLDFIENIAQNMLQHPDVYLQGGHNGPYFHPESDLRNKGHWMIICSRLYAWTGKEAYKLKASELAEYLLSTTVRPYGYSFYHRNAPRKDRCNGLVGQAWTFEALAQASETFRESSFIKLAEKVFLQHHFNEQHALWNILEIDGRILPIDNAFNHQLWFAAAISLVKTENLVVRERVTRFLDQLFNNVAILDSGLIYHEFDFELRDHYARVRKFDIKKKIKQQLMRILEANNADEDFLVLSPARKKKEKLWKKMKHKSIGYHAFNTYAFALLKQKFPDHAIWHSTLFRKVVQYLFTDEYKQGIEHNEFSYAYNPPGFEVPFSIQALLPPEQQPSSYFAGEWVNNQIHITYNPHTKMFDRNNPDPLTLTARLYEVTRLEASVLKNIVIDNI